MEGKRKISI